MEPSSNIASLINIPTAKKAMHYLSECEDINLNVSLFIDDFGFSSKLTDAEDKLNDLSSLLFIQFLTECFNSIVSLTTYLFETQKKTQELISILNIKHICAAWGRVVYTGLCRSVFNGIYLLCFTSLAIVLGFILLLQSIYVLHFTKKRSNLLCQRREKGMPATMEIELVPSNNNPSLSEITRNTNNGAHMHTINAESIAPSLCKPEKV
jgi:hypothetical protein